MEEEALAMTSVADGSVDGEVNEFKQICERLVSNFWNLSSGHPLANQTQLLPQDTEALE